jgi:hypothetical protein
VLIRVNANYFKDMKQLRMGQTGPGLFFLINPPSISFLRSDGSLEYLIRYSRDKSYFRSQPQ